MQSGNWAADLTSRISGEMERELRLLQLRLAPVVFACVEDGRLEDNERAVFHKVLEFHGIGMNDAENRKQADTFLDEQLEYFRATGKVSDRESADAAAHDLAVSFKSFSWRGMIESERSGETDITAVNDFDIFSRLEAQLAPLAAAIVEDDHIAEHEVRIFMSAMRYFGIKDDQRNQMLARSFLERERKEFHGAGKQKSATQSSHEEELERMLGKGWATKLFGVTENGVGGGGLFSPDWTPDAPALPGAGITQVR